jgi:hypothetical protein
MGPQDPKEVATELACVKRSKISTMRPLSLYSPECLEEEFSEVRYPLAMPYQQPGITHFDY